MKNGCNKGHHHNFKKARQTLVVRKCRAIRVFTNDDKSEISYFLQFGCMLKIFATKM